MFLCLDLDLIGLILVFATFPFNAPVQFVYSTVFYRPSHTY